MELCEGVQYALIIDVCTNMFGWQVVDLGACKQFSHLRNKYQISHQKKFSLRII